MTQAFFKIGTVLLSDQMQAVRRYLAARLIANRVQITDHRHGTDIMCQQGICSAINRKKTAAVPPSQRQIRRTTRASSNKSQWPIRVKQIVKFVQIIFPAQKRLNIAMST